MSTSDSHDASDSTVSADGKQPTADVAKSGQILAVLKEHATLLTVAATLLAALIAGVFLLLSNYGAPFIQEFTSRSRVRAEQLEKEKAALQSENSALKKGLQGENADLTKALKAAEDKYADYVRDQQDKARASSDAINDARTTVRSLQASLDREVQSRLEADRTILELKGQSRDISTAQADALYILNEPDTASSEAEYLHQRAVEQAEKNKAGFRLGYNMGGDDSIFGQLIKQSVDNAQDAQVGESTADYARFRIGRLNARIDRARERLTRSLSAAHILQTPADYPSSVEPSRRQPSSVKPSVKRAQPVQKNRP